MSKRYTPKKATTETPAEETPEEGAISEIFDRDLSTIAGDENTSLVDAIRAHRDEMLADEGFVALRDAVESGAASLAQRDEYAPLAERVNEAAAAMATAGTEVPTIVDVEDPVPPGDTPPGDTGSGEGDTPPGDTGEGDTPGDEPAEPAGTDAQQLVTAAMALIASQSAPKPATPLALSNTAVVREIAPLVSSVRLIQPTEEGATATVELSTAPMTDADWGAKVADLSRSGGEIKETVDLGGWRVWDTTADQVISNIGATTASITNRSMATGDKLIGPKTAAPCAPGCIRMDIADCGNMADPLNIFSEYPCDRGMVTYFRGYNMSEVATGITVWDEAKQAAFNAAYEAYNEALNTGSVDDIASSLAAVKACEKRCAIVKCREGDKAVVLPIMVCIKLTNETSYSQPEALVAARGALQRLMLRERNRQRRTLMQAFSHHFNIDAAAYGGLSAGRIVLDTLLRALAMGSVKERTSHGGYVMGIDFGLLALLRSDRFMGCHAMEALEDAADMPIRILYDAAYTDAPTNMVPGVEPFAYDLPKPGPGNAVDMPNWPKKFSIELFNPDDFDTFSVPDITVRGTRSHDDLMQNMVTALILETFEGIMKPGCNPSYTLNFDNLCPTGAGIGCIEPDGCVVPGEPFEADNDDDPATGDADESTVDSGSGQVDQTGTDPNPEDGSHSPGGAPTAPGAGTTPAP